MPSILKLSKNIPKYKLTNKFKASLQRHGWTGKTKSEAIKFIKEKLSGDDLWNLLPPPSQTEPAPRKSKA
jgi:hypothetical protein